MSTLAIEVNPLAERIECTDDELIVYLVDGRKVSVPMAWYPRLAMADDKQKAHWELLGDGQVTDHSKASLLNHSVVC